MKCRTVTVPPSSASPFYVQALQYTPEPEYSRDDGLTLILFHAMNLHKETFHGLVARVLEDPTINSEGGVKIKDIWCIDNPNHGLSALLNAQLLGTDERKDKWGAMEYSRAAHALLSATSHGVDFRKRNIVGAAHSAGATSLMLLETLLPPSINIVSFVLLEPGLLPPQHHSSKSLPQLFAKMALAKRNTWPTREAAKKDLRGKAAYRAWDEEVFGLFIKYALKEVDSSGTVMLACSPKQEAAHYRNPDIVIPPSEIFERLAREDRVPIHLIEARKDEYRGMSDEMKAYHIEIVSKMTIGSVQYIEKGGHLWPQCEPALGAQIIVSTLARIRVPAKHAKL
ncbi:AB hydrolase superfamily protein [Pleurotus pulmonarius]